MILVSNVNDPLRVLEGTRCAPRTPMVTPQPWHSWVNPALPKNNKIQIIIPQLANVRLGSPSEQKWGVFGMTVLYDYGAPQEVQRGTVRGRGGVPVTPIRKVGGSPFISASSKHGTIMTRVCINTRDGGVDRMRRFTVHRCCGALASRHDSHDCWHLSLHG